MTVEEYLAQAAREIDAFLDEHLPPAGDDHDRLYEAVRYCVFSGGKRFRPALALATCEALGGDTRAALPPAAALELVHVSSLIHDDLPCMDDAGLRRGRPSCHKAYSEAMAVLAGDWLLTYPYRLLAETHEAHGLSRDVTLLLIREITGAVCAGGIVEGQAEDLAAERKAISVGELQALHGHKTGALINAAVRCGLLVAGMDEGDLEKASAFTEPMGLAFQIADDILDVTGDEDVLGKPTGGDKGHEKNTYVSFYGLERAREVAGETAERAHSLLDGIGDHADTAMLHALVDFVVQRRR